MACSRIPGVLRPDDLWAAARTPGPLGLNDQADPNHCTLLGDSPGVLGIQDYADPTLWTFTARGARIATMMRLADGTALAMPVQAGTPGPERAPWMKIAEEQARKFKGARKAKSRRH